MASYLQAQTVPFIFMDSSFIQAVAPRKAWKKSGEGIFSPRRQFERKQRTNNEDGLGVMRGRRQGVLCSAFFLPVDPWAPSIDSQSIASQLFALSLLPYLGFLYFITKSKSAPRLTLFGFYFLLAFVGATIPAGIYAKVHYGTSLSNVDWLHGGAESLLTLTNIFIVLGLRKAIRNGGKENGKTSSNSSNAVSEVTKEQSSV